RRMKGLIAVARLPRVWVPFAVIGLAVAVLAVGVFGAGPALSVPGAAAPQEATSPNVPFPVPPELAGVELNQQSDADVTAKSGACGNCHPKAHDPHYKNTLHIA